MKQEQKVLLLKDLCARLPYGIKLECKWKTPAPNGTYGMITTMDSFVLDQVCNIEDTDVPFDEFKPYLFPLSSMTEEQKKEYNSLRNFVPTYHYEFGDIVEDTELYDNFESIDYLIANHFDYRGLIERGLAIDATGLNIY